MRLKVSKYELPLKNAGWIFLRETGSLLGTISAPVTAGTVIFFCGLVGVLLALSQGTTYEQVTHILFYFLYLIILLSSVMFSSPMLCTEKRQGTLELMYSIPVQDVEIVIGKFAAAAFYYALLIPSIVFVYVAGIAKAPWYEVTGGIVALYLAALYGTSVGLFASSLTSNYLISLVTSVAIISFIDIGGFLAGLLPSPAREIFTHLHAINHYTPFTRGTIPLRGLLFFTGFTLYFLFLTVKSLESRRWR